MRLLHSLSVRELKIRRRRAAAALAVGVVAVAAGLSVALGDGSGSDPGGIGPDPSGTEAGDLPPAQLVGERLVAGFAGTSPPAGLRRMIHAGELGGVILYSDNFGDRSEARRLVRRLQSIRRPPGLRDPLLVMVDQEGGEVKRLPGAPQASAAEMGRRGASFSLRQGRLTAGNLARAGINIDLAPVLDVGRPGGVIRDAHRSFGDSAAKVSATAIPFASGLQAGGVAATGKHFPGLGAATVNTDFGVERIGLSMQTLRGVDEVPFEDFSAAGGDLVMMSLAVYPAFSPRPAAFSRALATGELRDRIGFRGVSITDALNAVAAEAFGGPAKVGRAAAAAGTDLLLFRYPRAAARAGASLRAALRDGRLARDEFERSAQRVLDLRAGLGP
jgi:beta-N-acetylhexosaminidase